MAVPADWDFSATNWILDVSQYVSPPSSLRIASTGLVPIGQVALCKKADSLCLPQGRIVTYLRTSPACYPNIHFRNQAANGSADPLNDYNLFGTVGTFRFYRVVAGVDTTLDNWGAAWFTANTWHLLRLSWWTAYDTQNVKSLAMRLERFFEGEWVIDRTYYDTENLWADSDVNRVGVGSRRHPTYYCWFDDTEIWKPSE